ncbi:MAG: sterol desaturase family protein [Mariprofundaceae bacterium]|nr:sterol desaturase family protein [Mariprofundaceae bacterium]
MNDEAWIRLCLFAGVLAIMAVWELLAPKRRLKQGYRRWPGNLGIVAVDSVLVRLVFPAGAIGAALWATEHGWGLLNLVALPDGVAIIIAVVLLDLAIYLQHLLVHAVPLLWRLHMVHHADLDIDVTTGLRFHPFEILLSMAIKIGVVVLFGAPALAVLLFELILNAMAMFNHSNVRLPQTVDAVVRCLLVTPDMHRVHHSVIRRETNSNFGFNLSVWDRLFGTYTARPQLGHRNMLIGLEQFQDMPAHRLAWMLRLPFTGFMGQYPMMKFGRGPENGDVDE